MKTEIMSLLSSEQFEKLSRFVEHADMQKTATFLDVDQTIVHEVEGKITFTRSVERGLKDIHDLRIPVVLNTLRFPLSVIRTLGEEWYRIVGGRIPVVLLNGSTIGYIARAEGGTLEYQELESFSLGEQEISGLIEDASLWHTEGVKGVALFYYPRNWKSGEIIWTPDREAVPFFRQKFTSASDVISTDIVELGRLLRQQEICMVYRHFETPEDHLMAYQHSGRSHFITRTGVDKAFGTRMMAEKMGASVTLEHSLGAGDTRMDSFLAEVGMAVQVGNMELPYKGRVDTIRVQDPLQLGELLFAFADLAKSKLQPQ